MSPAPTAAHPLAADLEHIDRHAADAWEALRGARLFVTGGTGFYGKWLLESLAWSNHRRGLGLHTVVLTRRPGAFCVALPHLAADPAIDFAEGDVRDFIFPAGRFTHVVHAATPASTQPTELEETLDIIVGGTRRVLDFACAAGAQRVLLASSGAVYGRQPPELWQVAEDYCGGPDPCDLRSTYGEGKRLAEHLGALYHRRHGLAVSIARGFAFIGPHLPLDGSFAVGNFFRDALAGGPVRVTGDGSPYRSYLYAADLAIWLWTILTRGRPCRPYNVGGEDEISIAALAHKIAAHFSTDVVLAQPIDPGRPTERYVPSTARARAELGLHVHVDLDAAVHRTVHFLRRAAA
jgi:dTDP-glucose 4,6-dehydratase